MAQGYSCGKDYAGVAGTDSQAQIVGVINNKERAYDFSTPDQLIADFQHDIARWNRENRNS